MDEKIGSVQKPHTHKFKEKELIETIKKVSLEKDDILILQVSNTTMDQQRSLIDYCDINFPNIKVVILPKEIDINVLSLKDFNKGEMNEY